MKNYVISKNIPLILGSQTIGPFRDKNIQSIASETISKCYAVYARDKNHMITQWKFLKLNPD